MYDFKKARKAALFVDSLLMTVPSRKARVRILRSTRECSLRMLSEMNGIDYYRPDRDRIIREIARKY